MPLFKKRSNSNLRIHFDSKAKLLAYVTELVQHLLAVGQVWSHELGSIHLDLLPDFPGWQARLEEGRGRPNYLPN